MAFSFPRNRTLLLGILACVFVAAFLTLLTFTRENAAVWPRETLIPTLDGSTIAVTQGEQANLTARLVGKDVNNVEIHRFERGEGAAGFNVVANMHNLLQCPEGLRSGTVEALYGILNDRNEREWAYVYDGAEAQRKSEGKTGEALFPRTNFWVSQKETSLTPNLIDLRHFQGSLAGKMVYLMSEKSHLISCFDTDHDRINDRQEDTDNNGQRTTGETNLVDADSDDDGLIDGDEIEKGTNPLQVDTDGDGIQDGTELGYVVCSEQAAQAAGSLLIAQTSGIATTLKVQPGAGDITTGTVTPLDIVLTSGVEIGGLDITMHLTNLQFVDFSDTNPPSVFDTSVGDPVVTPNADGSITIQFSRVDFDAGPMGNDLQVLRVNVQSATEGPATFTFDPALTEVIRLTDSEKETVTFVDGSYAVTPPNIPPTLTVPGTQTIQVGQTLTFTVTTEDPDGGPGALTLTGINLPNWSTFASLFFGSLLLIGSLSFKGIDRRKLLVAASIGAVLLLILVLKTGIPISRFRGQVPPGGITKTFTGTPTDADIGTHTVTFEAGDGADVTRTDVVINVTAEPPPPQLAITEPQNGSTVIGSNVQVLYLASGDLTEVDHVHLTMDSDAEQRDLDFDGAFTFMNVPAGQHTVSAYLARADHTQVGDAVSASLTVEIPTVNQAPSVNAGADQTITLPTNAATLDGTVTDDGLPNPPNAFTVIWSKVSGPGTVTFGDAAAPDTTATFSSLGTYVLKLEVTDSVLSASDEVQITVRPPVSTARCISPDTNLSIFVPDADPLTATNPLNVDTDGGGASDGTEDPNHNGKVDVGEKDPQDPGDDGAGQ